VRREVEVDTKLADLYGHLGATNARLDSNKLSLARYAGIRPVYVTKTRREVKESASELAATVAGMLADGKIPRWEEERARETLADRERLLGEHAAIRAEMEPLNAEYDAKPWSRFFLVQNQGGHIHSSMACSTCHPTTSFGWLPTLSGLHEADAVAEHGPLLCTVCFPSAPVEWTLGPEKKEDPDRCPGSGQYATGGQPGRRYKPCNVCGQSMGVTSTGKTRTHKKPKEAKV
jgi:hypothetical protein